MGVESVPPPAQISRPRVQFSGIEERSDQKARPRAKRSSKTRVGCACAVSSGAVPTAGVMVRWVDLMLGVLDADPKGCSGDAFRHSG